MKIARVFYAEYQGKAIGDIFDVFEFAHHPGTIIPHVLKEVEVPDDFDKSVMKATVAENGAISFEEDAEKVAEKNLQVKLAQVGVKYNEMNSEVYAKMAEVFGTTKSDSATAFHETWKLMAAKPELFINKGLKADRTVGSVTAGSLFTQTAKVVEYAEGLISAAEDYAVWRMLRIKEFEEDKAEILAG